MENLIAEVAERVARVTVNRPKQLNALNRATLGELESAFTELGARDDVAVVIVTGAGDKAFIAGADISELAELGPAEARAYALAGQRLMTAIEELGKPVIAALNGYALGGGLELAMACSLRIAAQGCELGQPEINLGLIPGFAGTQRLARLVGKGRAHELLLTGDRIKADEALRIGLVNRVVPAADLEGAARALAARLADKAPRAMTFCMEAVNRGLETARAEGERLEATLFGLCFATEDMKEGTRAFLEKRKPNFKGR